MKNKLKAKLILISIALICVAAVIANLIDTKTLSGGWIVLPKLFVFIFACIGIYGAFATKN